MKPTIKKVLTIVIISCIIMTVVLLPCSAYATKTTNGNVKYYPLAFDRINFYGRTEADEPNYNDVVSVTLPQSYAWQNTTEMITFDTIIENSSALVSNNLDGNNKISQRQYVSSTGQNRTYMYGNLDPKQRYMTEIELYAPFGVIDENCLTDFCTIYLRSYSYDTIYKISLEYDVLEPLKTPIPEENKTLITYTPKHYKIDNIAYNATDGDNSNITVNLPLRTVWEQHKEIYIVDDYNYKEIASIFNVKVKFSTYYDSEEVNKYLYFNYSAWQTDYDIKAILNLQTEEIDTGDVIYENISISDFNLLDFVTNAVNNFLEIEIFPNFTFGWLLWIVIGISVLFIFLKVFLGG